MQFLIQHQTRYRYSQPVQLEPHRLLLRPRSSPHQQVQRFQLTLDPTPVGQYECWDLHGNTVLHCWFRDPTSHFDIAMQVEVTTHCPNPFDYVLEPWAVHLPLDYSQSWQQELAPYLTPLGDVTVQSLAWEWWEAVNGETSAFIGLANQQIYESCQYLIREVGDPWPAGLTWKRRQGSCRDLAVLLIEVCRSVGLAARFVSGYASNPEHEGSHYLHGWVEIYLPGAGWRGYDPTQGLAVAEHHIAVAASGIPRRVTPVQGGYRPGHISSHLTTTLQIMATDSPRV